VIIPLDGQGPLCPNVNTLRLSPEHFAANQQGDRLYEAAAPWRDDDGEYFNAGVEALMAVAYPEDRMRLYRESVGPTPAGLREGIASFNATWFQCHTCGLILPATVERMPAR
jgi:hypothetical protein